MKKLIIEYLKTSIECKKGLKKEIKEIHRILDSLAQAEAYQLTLIEEYKDLSYKTKFQNEHKKFKEYEKESKEIIKEFTDTINELERENKKLKKEAN